MTRRRQDIARAALLVWVVGFELAPGLHLVLHDWLAPHSHGPRVSTGPGAEHRSTGASDHRHGDTWHSHSDSLPDGEGHEPAQPAPAEPDHGANSLAHHMVVALEPPPTAIPARGRLIEPPLAPVAAVQAPRSAAPMQPCVRGPPPSMV